MLAKNPDTGVLRAAASNYNCDPDLLEMLARSGNKYMRRAGAANPNCDPEVLAMLANDPYQQVRIAAAANPNCDSDTLWALTGDLCDDVASAAVAHRNHPTRKMGSSDRHRLDNDPQPAALFGAGDAISARYADDGRRPIRRLRA